MSVTDPAADPVQPEDAGQGGEGTGGTPYAEYLDRIPEDARGVAEEAFRAWDANYTRHQQEASEYRNQWEPFEQAGIRQYTPDHLSWALQVAQAAQNDPAALRTWLDQTHGPLAPPEPTQPQADEFGFQDPQQQLNALLEQRLAPFQQQMEQLAQWREAQEQQAALQSGQQVIDQQFGEIEAKHGKLDPETRELVEAIATTKYADTDPMNAIPRAYRDYEAFVNQVEKRTLQGKVDQPKPPEGAGPPNSAPEKVTTLAEAGALAREQLRAAFRGNA